MYVITLYLPLERSGNNNTNLHVRFDQKYALIFVFLKEFMKLTLIVNLTLAYKFVLRKYKTTESAEH